MKTSFGVCVTLLTAVSASPRVAVVVPGQDTTMGDIMCDQVFSMFFRHFDTREFDLCAGVQENAGVHLLSPCKAPESSSERICWTPPHLPASMLRSFRAWAWKSLMASMSKACLRL